MPGGMSMFYHVFREGQGNNSWIPMCTADVDAKGMFGYLQGFGDNQKI